MNTNKINRIWTPDKTNEGKDETRILLHGNHNMELNM